MAPSVSPHHSAGTTIVQRCSFFVFAAASRQAANAATLGFCRVAGLVS
jgi:hypothetical protein